MDARELVKRLGGRWHGRSGMARCPAHADRTPSLSIKDGDLGRPIVHCFGGCAPTDVIAALDQLGLWPARSTPLPRACTANADHRPAAGNVRSTGEDSAQAARIERARALWRAAVPAGGTIVESYLRARGIGLPPPVRLRFHACCPHPSGDTLPAMIAAVTDASDRLSGIHRTYLRADGGGKAAIEPAKAMLGPVGGGAVRLAPGARELHIAEGIETALAAMTATGTPTWAALSAGGVCALVLPDAVRDVVLLADADPTGEAAARDAAARWVREGRRVRIARPPIAGTDFADLLLAGGARA